MTAADSSRSIEQVEEQALRSMAREDYRGTLTTLMEHYGPAIYRYCRQLTRDDSLAQEAHQTVFIQAYEGLERYRGKSTLRAWLYGIARHRCLDAIKARRRRNRRFPLTDVLPEVESAPPGVLDALENATLVKALRHCLETLKPAVRAMMLLRFVEGLTYVEISSITRSKPAAAQARVSRAMPALRDCIQGQGVGP